MIGVRLSAPGVSRLAIQLNRAPISSGVKMRSLVTHWTAMMELNAKKRARALFAQGVTAGGHPLSRPHTGDYIRSIGREVTSGGIGRAEGRVWTNLDQNYRLEFGFVGKDSLGRNYNQPPYPHMRPAADEIEPEFFAAAAAAFGDL
jgi:hypothetical protein